MDPMKLVVGLAGTGAHGVQVEHDLLRAGLPLEMADRDTLVAVVSLADTAVDLVRLTGALTAAVERHRGAPRAVVPAASWMVEPDLVVSPREAFFADTETVPVAEAVGRVSAELVAPYPPGIPVLAPGERVNADALDALMQAREDGVRIAYAADPTLARLQVMRTSPALDPDRLE
jgi:lysine decarboxylase